MVGRYAGVALRIRVYPANWADTEGGQRLLKTLPLTPRLKEVRADQGYDSRALMRWCEQVLGVRLSMTQPEPERLCGATRTVGRRANLGVVRAVSTLEQRL